MINMKFSADDRRELFALLVDIEGLSRGAAKAYVAGLAPEGQLSALMDLRLRKKRRDIEEMYAPKLLAAPVAVSRAKKVPYTLLMQPEHLAALRVLADRDGSSVSHHMRQAIRAYLKGVRL